MTREAGDEYAVVSFRPSWTSLSFGVFVLLLASRWMVRWIPLGPPLRYWRGLLWVPAAALLAIVGLGCGLVALRQAALRPGGGGSARLAVLLNGTALVLCALGTLALYLIRNR